MSTAIATWGNSDAVRIPRDVLAKAGLKTGDRIDFAFGPGSAIIIIPAEKAHRRVAPARGVTFESLFAGYEGDRFDSSAAWPPDGLEGAELDAWAS